MMKLRALAFGVIVAGCSPSLEDLPKLSDQNVSETHQTLGVAPSADLDAPLVEQDDVQAAIASVDLPQAEPETGGGLFGALRRALPIGTASTGPDPERIAAIAPKAEVLPQTDLTINKPTSTAVLPVSGAPLRAQAVPPSDIILTEEAASLVVPASVVAPVTEKPKGLFGLLRRTPNAEQNPADGLLDADKAEQIAPSQPILENKPAVIEAAVKAPQTPKARRGLFAPRKPSAPTGPDAQQVPLGAPMAYGEIARVCGANRGSLGREVGRFPDRGRGYKLYDSNPGSTALRPHYITGFDDGCVRQFSAALALFGGTEFHEQVRYQKTSRDFPYTETDNAYETLKSQVCRVGRNTPCPSSRVEKLQKDTVFVTVYQRFGNNPSWASILLHDGAVLTKSIKAR